MWKIKSAYCPTKRKEKNILWLLSQAKNSHRTGFKYAPINLQTLLNLPT